MKLQKDRSLAGKVDGKKTNYYERCIATRSALARDWPEIILAGLSSFLIVWSPVSALSRDCSALWKGIGGGLLLVFCDAVGDTDPPRSVPADQTQLRELLFPFFASGSIRRQGWPGALRLKHECRKLDLVKWHASCRWVSGTRDEDPVPVRFASSYHHYIEHIPRRRSMCSTGAHSIEDPSRCTECILSHGLPPACYCFDLRHSQVVVT